jgi:hypothetical protein
MEVNIPTTYSLVRCVQGLRWEFTKFHTEDKSKIKGDENMDGGKNCLEYKDLPEIQKYRK